MNDPVVKWAMAISILFGGLAVGSLFCSHSPTPAIPGSATVTPSPPTPSPATAQAPPTPPDTSRNSAATSSASAVPIPLVQSNIPASKPIEPIRLESTSPATAPIVLKPMGDPPAIPHLSEKYPGDGLRPGVYSTAPISSSLMADASTDIPRSHRIVDGDTLEILAERYLGSVSRSGEIFAANRAVLTKPELLPIGEWIHIPPRKK